MLIILLKFKEKLHLLQETEYKILCLEYKYKNLNK